MASCNVDGKNKIDFVDDTIPKLEENSPQFRFWMHHNSMVSSWLLISVSKEISASFIYVENAAEIWKELQDCFELKNSPRAF